MFVNYFPIIHKQFIIHKLNLRNIIFSIFFSNIIIMFFFYEFDLVLCLSWNCVLKYVEITPKSLNIKQKHLTKIVPFRHLRKIIILTTLFRLEPWKEISFIDITWIFTNLHKIFDKMSPFFIKLMNNLPLTF